MNNRIQGQHSRFQRERERPQRQERTYNGQWQKRCQGRETKTTIVVKLLIFGLLGHEWVVQGPGFELGQHGQVDGASIIANQLFHGVQVLLGHVSQHVSVGKVCLAVKRGGWHTGWRGKNEAERCQGKAGCVRKNVTEVAKKTMKAFQNL